MSLVDYAASDDDVSDSDEDKPQPPPSVSLRQTNNPISSSSNQLQESDVALIEKLPDPSMLLNSPLIGGFGSGGGDHASLVEAAMAESANKKRESNNGLAAAGSRRSKVPKGNLMHSKNVLETGGGTLLPPQLRGRSNVVTEDITKLFIKRHGEPRNPEL